jgi:hypothetical protein
MLLGDQTFYCGYCIYLFLKLCFSFIGTIPSFSFFLYIMKKVVKKLELFCFLENLR